MILAALVYGQSDEFADPFEINESKEEIQTEIAPEPVENKDPFDDIAIEDPATQKTEQNQPEPEEETVIIREKIEPIAVPAEPTGDNLVEIRSSNDIYLPYKQRQYPWGFVFSAGAEIVNFPNLIS